MADTGLEGMRMRKEEDEAAASAAPQLRPRALHFTPDCRGTELQRGMARA